VEATVEGENVMRMAALAVDPPPAMAPSVNIMCRITPDSPLWGKSYQDLESEGAAIYAALAATDNQHFQEVFMRKFYRVPVRYFVSFLGFGLCLSYSRDCQPHPSATACRRGCCAPRLCCPHGLILAADSAEKGSRDGACLRLVAALVSCCAARLWQLRAQCHRMPGNVQTPLEQAFTMAVARRT
jgi:hypothetical protein